MVTTEKTAFDNPVRAISTSGMLRYAVSLEDLLSDLLSGDEAFARQQFAAPVELTINGSGLLAAPTQTQITVAANSGTSDDLDSITAADETFVVLRAKTGHSISLRPGVGNIASWSGVGVTLTGYRMALLHCQGGTWALLNTPAPRVASATRDPGSDDDALDGYNQGSRWVNTTLDRVWVCVDATVGAAIWKLISPFKNGFRVRAADTTLAGVGVVAGAPTLVVANDAVNTWGSASTGGGSPGLFAEAAFTPSATPVVRSGHGFISEYYVKTGGNVDDQIIWAGWLTTGIWNGNTATVGRKFIGFRYSTTAPDVGWVPVLSDGATQNTGTAIGTVTVDTVYKMRVRVDNANSRVYFSVNDSTEQLLSSNYPDATSEFFFEVWIYNQIAAVKTVLFSSMDVGW